jgi:hypothetical protein
MKPHGAWSAVEPVMSLVGQCIRVCPLCNMKQNGANLAWSTVLIAFHVETGRGYKKSSSEIKA